MTNHKRDAVLISVKPMYADLIFCGKKTVELRRRFSEYLEPGSKMFIYSTSPVKKIIGYALVREVIKKCVEELWREVGSSSCVSYEFFTSYFDGLREGYGIVLEEPVIFDKQFSLDEINAKSRFTPPQSYMFLTDDLNKCLQAVNE